MQLCLIFVFRFTNVCMNAKFGEYAKICSEIIDLVNSKTKISYFCIQCLQIFS